MRRPLVFLDTETTGLDAHRHHIWEIAYAVDDGPIKAEVVSHPVPSLTSDVMPALRVNGYIDRGYQVNSNWSERWESDLKTALTDATLVGANPAFDASMLLARWNLSLSRAPWHYRLLDVEAYAMGVMGWDEPRGLSKIADALDVTPSNHTAAQDVATLRECFFKLAKMRSAS